MPEKEGAIKRLTEKMDARGYVVNPTAAPNDHGESTSLSLEILEKHAKGRAYANF